MQNNSRLDYVDVFKGIGIIFMIMGHIGFGSIFRKFIYAFHMPMFFFISGWLYSSSKYNKLSVKDFVLKRAKSLLIPYLFFALFHYAIWVVLNFKEGSIIQPLIHIFSINTLGMPIETALWFLTALFVTYILYFLIDKFIKNKIFKMVVIVIACFLGILTSKLNIELPFAISQGLVGLGFFSIAHYIKERCTISHNIIKLPTLLIFSLIIIVIPLIIFNPTINMREGTYGYSILFFINSLISIIIVLNISYRLININGSFVKLIMFIGRNSMSFLVLNHLSIFLFKGIMNILNFHSIIIINSLTLIFSIAFLCIWTTLLNRSKLKVLIGR